MGIILLVPHNNAFFVFNSLLRYEHARLIFGEMIEVKPK